MNKKGFSAPELMVTLFVAVVFISIGYGMHTYVYKEISFSKKRAIASNIAESHLRKRASLSELSDCDLGPDESKKRTVEQITREEDGKVTKKITIEEDLESNERLSGNTTIKNTYWCDPDQDKLMVFEIVVTYEFDGVKYDEKQVLYIDKK